MSRRSKHWPGADGLPLLEINEQRVTVKGAHHKRGYDRTQGLRERPGNVDTPQVFGAVIC